MQDCPYTQDALASHLANLISDLALVDIKLGGDNFTWSNKRVGMHCIQVRLDRAIITLD